MEIVSVPAPPVIMIPSVPVAEAADGRLPVFPMRSCPFVMLVAEETRATELLRTLLNSPLRSEAVRVSPELQVLTLERAIRVSPY